MLIKQFLQKPDGMVRHRSYLKQDYLGKGGFAECFIVQRMDDKRQFAIKIVDKKVLEKPKSKQKMLSEINLHKTAKHRNICSLQRVFQDPENVYMLLELCRNGNMFELLRRRKRLTSQETQYYIYQLIDGLCYLHNRQIVHRDVKLGNLLINQNMELKLADFGLATKLEYEGDRKHTVCGTPNYIAPEVISSSMGVGVSGHSYEVDVWSTGVIMYVMLVGRPPFESKKLDHIYEKVLKADFQFPDNFKDNAAKDLLKKMLTVDVSKRYTFAEVLAHEFMNPKNGIPKSIPTSCLTNAPKFENKFEKYSSESVKQSARNFSINTMRSEVQLTMNYQVTEDLQEARGGEDGKKGIKSLLKTVFSTSSLSMSLEKLANISGRTSSPHSNLAKINHTQKFTEKLYALRSAKAQQTPQLKNKSIEKVLCRSNRLMGQLKAKHEETESTGMSGNHVCILSFKKQVVFSYMLSSGYVGTHSPNYKLLYNRQDKMYFESDTKDGIQLVKENSISQNDNIENRKKFLSTYLSMNFECEPFVSISRIVYLKKILEAQSENVIMFRLSNGTIQIHSFELNCDLLVTDHELVLLVLENGKVTRKFIQKKDSYAESKNKQLLAMYLKFKKIDTQINSRKTNDR